MIVPLHTQSFSRLASEAIAITVVPTMERGGMQLTPATADAQLALSKLNEIFVSLARISSIKSPATWANQKIQALMSQSFENDVWYNQLPQSQLLVLIKDSAIAEHGMERVLRRVHASEVVAAVRHGLAVPSEVAAEYGAEIANIQAGSPALVDF